MGKRAPSLIASSKLKEVMITAQVMSPKRSSQEAHVKRNFHNV